MRLVSIASASLAGLALVLAVACSDDDSDGGSGDEGTRQLGDVTFNDEGAGDARGKDEFELEADSFYFGPTFIHGDPGATVTFEIENESDVDHNFSMGEIDTDIGAGETVSIEVTFPETGVALFFCKFHAGSGMNGELLAGDAEPAAPPAGARPAAGNQEARGGSTGYTY
jgi:plastocyanin